MTGICCENMRERERSGSEEIAVDQIGTERFLFHAYTTEMI